MVRSKLYLAVLFPVFQTCSGSVGEKCTDASGDNAPLADLVNTTFQGFEGGLYAGSNRTPKQHLQAGLAACDSIIPRNPEGLPSDTGRIGFLALGYSTAAMTFRYFQFMNSVLQEWPTLIPVVGAQAGMDINQMTDGTAYWEAALSQVSIAGLTPAQIQIVWLSTGDTEVSHLPFPEQSQVQVEKYGQVCRRIRAYFPNCAIVFISDRAYGGYIREKGAQSLREPGAYYSSWAVKWTIEAQIEDQTGFTLDEIPFIDWGPRLWTNGIQGDLSGYTWSCEDAGKGGIHPSGTGRAKEACKLYLHVRYSPYLKGLR